MSEAEERIHASSGPAEVGLSFDGDVGAASLEGHHALVNWLAREMEREGLAGRVDVIIVNDAIIAELNQRFLGHEGPTDVISFPLGDEQGEPSEPFVVPETGDDPSPAAPFPVGEVYVSLERARAQALEYGVDAGEELARLALHGLLHLADYDDQEAAARERMSRREDKGLLRGKLGGQTLPWSLADSDE